MKKCLIIFIGFLFICSFMCPTIRAYAVDLDQIQKISENGMNAYKMWMNVTAENIANASTTRTPEGGPYKRKFIVLVPTKAGVKVAMVSKDNRTPLVKVYDPGHPDADRYGFVYMPNVDISNELIKLNNISSLYEANMAALKTIQSMQEAVVDFYRQ
jgi:flagellar basal-body rod protein FlgC